MSKSDSSSTRYEILIGMTVDDEHGYTNYRAGMTPILESMGAFFRYDMRVSELLKGEHKDSFNRLFLMSFPDKSTSDRFFADPEYQRVKQEHFVDAVRSYTEIARFQHATHDL
jgi:uncharacterized protein (DUF1330 family)